MISIGCCVFSAVIVLLDIENWYLEAIEDMEDFLHPYGVWPGDL
jgi:hypothetical protein